MRSMSLFIASWNSILLVLVS